eukprot:3230357-Rhodomonas_salina.3
MRPSRSNRWTQNRSPSSSILQPAKPSSCPGETSLFDVQYLHSVTAIRLCLRSVAPAMYDLD